MGQRNQYWGTNERYRDASRQLGRDKKATNNVSTQQEQRPDHGRGSELRPLFINSAQPDHMRNNQANKYNHPRCRCGRSRQDRYRCDKSQARHLEVDPKTRRGFIPQSKGRQVTRKDNQQHHTNC